MSLNQPRFTDPLAGSSYGRGQVMPSADANALWGDSRLARLASVQSWKATAYVTPSGATTAHLFIGYGTVAYPVSFVAAGNTWTGSLLGYMVGCEPPVAGFLTTGLDANVAYCYPVRVQAGAAPGLLFGSGNSGTGMVLIPYTTAPNSSGGGFTVFGSQMKLSETITRGVSYAMNTGNTTVGALLAHPTGIIANGSGTLNNASWVSLSISESIFDVAVNGPEIYTSTSTPLATQWAALASSTSKIYYGALPMSTAAGSYTPGIGNFYGLAYCTTWQRWVLWTSTGVYTTADITSSASWTAVLPYAAVQVGISDAGLWLAVSDAGATAVFDGNSAYVKALSVLASADGGVTWTRVTALPDTAMGAVFPGSGCQINMNHIDYFAGQFRLACVNAAMISRRTDT